MPKLIDLTGQRFGRLTVIERAADHHVVTMYPDGTKRTFMKVRFRCLCDCGKETIVESASLKRGTTKSCGCYRRERTAAMGRANRKS